MLIEEHLERSGNWLFRHRGQLPIVLLALMVAGMLAFQPTAGRQPPGALRDAACLALGLVGLLIRVVAVGHAAPGTSGRNTREQVAEALNTTGLYSIVRHPLYVGNYLMWLGVTLVPAVWWVPVTASLVFWLYYERIIFAEERFLQDRFGDGFRAFAERTPAFLPSFANRVPAELPFSLRQAVGREHTGLLALATAFTAVRTLRNWLLLGRLELEPAWLTPLALSALAYGLVHLVRKRTPWLDVRETGQNGLVADLPAPRS